MRGLKLFSLWRIVWSYYKGLFDSANIFGEISPLLPTSNPMLEDGTPAYYPSLSFYGTNGSLQMVSLNLTIQPARKSSQSHTYVVILLVLFLVVANFGGSFVDTPKVCLLKMAVC